MMRKTLQPLLAMAFTLLAFSISIQNVQAQKDSTQMQKAAAAVCKCMSKPEIKEAKGAEELEGLFLQCMLESAGESLTEIMTKAMESGMSVDSISEKFGQELGLEMVRQNCTSFIQMSVKMSEGNEKATEKNTKIQALSELSGTVVSVTEGEFLSVIVETENGRKQTLYYFDYVPKSDDWLKDTKLLTGKKVSIFYKETEFYRPKLKTFIPIKQIVELNLMAKKQ